MAEGGAAPPLHEEVEGPAAADRAAVRGASAGRAAGEDQGARAAPGAGVSSSSSALPTTTTRAPRLSTASTSSSSSLDDGDDLATARLMPAALGGRGGGGGGDPKSTVSAASAASAATAAVAAAILPSPRGARPPLPPPSPVDAAALVLASAAAAAAEQRQRRRRRRRRAEMLRRLQQQQEKEGALSSSSSSLLPPALARLCSALLSAARSAPLVAAAALAGAFVPSLMAPSGSLIVRQGWPGDAGGGLGAGSASSVVLRSSVSRVDAAAGMLELAFSATAALKAAETPLSGSIDPFLVTERLMVGVGTFVALELDLLKGGGSDGDGAKQQPRHHHFTARVPLLPTPATVRSGALPSASIARRRRNTPSPLPPLPFPFDEWSSVVQVWAAVERCGGTGGDNSRNSNNSNNTNPPLLCTREAVPLEWIASMSARSWRARIARASARRVPLAEGEGGEDDTGAPALAPAPPPPTSSSSSSSSPFTDDAVSLAQLRVTLARPAPARILALLEMAARWLLGGYAALAAANWAAAALVLGPLLRGGHPRAFGAQQSVGGRGSGIGPGSNGGGIVEATEIFSTLD